MTKVGVEGVAPEGRLKEDWDIVTDLLDPAEECELFSMS